MKRKVTLHGPATLSVSLPTAWAKKHGVQKGDEIDVEEFRNCLKIITTKEKEGNFISIDLTGYLDITHRMLSSIYKSGFDSLEVIYSAEEKKIVVDTINEEWIGFEIMEQSDKRISAQKVTEMSKEDVKAFVLRTFHFVHDMGNDCLQLIKDEKFDDLPSVVEKDTQVNKLTNFCRRAINKEILTGITKPGPLYFIAEELEKIGDAYKHISQDKMENKEKVGKSLLEVFSLINTLLHDAQSMYSAFSLDKMKEFKEKQLSIQDALDKEISKKSDVKLLIELNMLFELVFDLNGAIISISH